MPADSHRSVGCKWRGAALALAALFALSTGCEDETTSTIASFVAPWGLAVAGEPEHLFVSNRGEDTLAVLRLGTALSDMKFLLSPTQHFALRIPAGSGPADLAATPRVTDAEDPRFGLPQYVVILDLFTESLRLLEVPTQDAAAENMLLVRDEGGDILELPLGMLGSRPAAMVASPVLCDDPRHAQSGGLCLGRVYVALAGSGAVLAVDVVSEGSGENARARLEPADYFDVSRPGLAGEPAVVGAPEYLSVDASGRLLFASDAGIPEVIRLDLNSGTVERRAVGGLPGPLAVSRDGSVLAVSRPEWRDLVIVSDASAPGFAPVDVDPAWTPIPSCLLACDEDATLCAEAHPADRAVCAGEAGLESAAGVPAYGGLYLGRVVGTITTLGEGAGQPPLSACSGDEKRLWSEYAVVTTLDGAILFVGLVGAQDPATPAPVLVSDTCGVPDAVPGALTTDVVITDSSGETVPDAIDSYLAACPEAPDRARFVCLPSGDAGVVILPRNLPDQDGEVAGVQMVWSLQWEGVLLESGAGEIPVASADGQTRDDQLRDPTADFSAVEVDDWVEITGSPLATCPIGELCELERRIVDITGNTLTVDRPWPDPAACFRAGGGVDYRIRAGGDFLATSGSTRARLRADAADPRERRLGPSGSVGRQQPVIFEVQPFEPFLERTACERYDAEAPLLDGALSREVEHRLIIEDRFGSILPGVFDQGRTPSAMVVWPRRAGTPVVFVSFASSNRVLGFVPNAPQESFTEPENFQLQ